MPTFWKSLFGSFIGKIIATIFITICAAIGFGPEKWTLYLINGLPNYFTPKVTRYLLLLLATIIFVSLCFGKIFSSLKKLWKFLQDKFCEIRWFDGPHSIHTFGYVISRPHNVALAGHIQIKGINNRKTSLIIKHAYLRSLVTSEKIIAKINSLKAENLEVIGKGNFTVLVSLPNDDGSFANNSIKGLTFDNFLKRFSNFEIVIQTDKKQHRIEFNSTETKEWVSKIQSGLMTQQPSEKASVLKLS